MANTKDWNPEAYLKFRNERTQPSIDLVNRIQIDYYPQDILDVGCGPGNSGQVLINRWPKAKSLGIDSSVNMIERAKKDYPSHEWLVTDASQINLDRKFDIVFSNATIQWVPNHEKLLPVLSSLLTQRGVLAVQLPLFNEMPLGKAIDKISHEQQWVKKNGHCSGLFTYHNHGFYYDLLAGHFNRLEMWETHYFHTLESQPSIIEWIRSTGLKPYLDCLSSDSERTQFELELLNEIKMDYPVQADGKVLFPFKRLFMVGYKE